MDELLKKIYVELVKYFEDEKLVYNAINNIKIINSNSIYDSLKDKQLLDNFSKNSYDKLKIIGGIYISIPYVDDNVIEHIDRYVMLCKFRSEDKYCVGTLVHELCHVIKSYKDEFIIKDNYLINNSGLLNKEYKLNDNLEIIGAKVNNIALEEAITVYQEEKIMHNLGYDDYVSLSYLGSNNIIRDLINTFDLEKLIKVSELNHIILDLKNYLNDNYDEFINVLNKVFEMDSNMIINESNEDKNKKLDVMLNYIDNNYYPLKEKIKVRGK